MACDDDEIVGAKTTSVTTTLQQRRHLHLPEGIWTTFSETDGTGVVVDNDADDDACVTKTRSLGAKTLTHATMTTATMRNAIKYLFSIEGKLVYLCLTWVLPRLTVVKEAYGGASMEAQFKRAMAKKLSDLGREGGQAVSRNDARDTGICMRG